MDHTARTRKRVKKHNQRSVGGGDGGNDGGMGDVYDFATDFQPVQHAFDSEEDESSSGIF